jgi:hypothetical protein
MHPDVRIQFSYILTCPSAPAAKTDRLLGEAAKARTSALWSVNACKNVPRFPSQNCVLPELSPLTTVPSLHEIKRGNVSRAHNDRLL